ncbi:unnamed protein product [Haemonchus placei]|uniref:Uncharacterized protein n=1 Tax=Haemonchus placei TaxID=6290 RepID=A0A3P7ZUF0_HAEPC|nr:unnamed protein product [Haemonchus placei]
MKARLENPFRETIPQHSRVHWRHILLDRGRRKMQHMAMRDRHRSAEITALKESRFAVTEKALIDL